VQSDAQPCQFNDLLAELSFLNDLLQHTSGLLRHCIMRKLNHCFSLNELFDESSLTSQAFSSTIAALTAECKHLRAAWESARPLQADSQ